MSDLKAEAYLVSDVSKTAEGTGWRWTYKRPELRFYVDSTVNRRFSMDFSIIPAAFEQTGPVTLSVFINNKLLGKKRCQRPGDYHFEAPVPPAWLNTDTPTVVVAQVDKLYTAPADGAQLGYTLSRAGFR